MHLGLVSQLACWLNGIVLTKVNAPEISLSASTSIAGNVAAEEALNEKSLLEYDEEKQELDITSLVPIFKYAPNLNKI